MGGVLTPTAPLIEVQLPRRGQGRSSREVPPAHSRRPDNGSVGGVSTPTAVSIEAGFLRRPRRGQAQARRSSE